MKGGGDSVEGTEWTLRAARRNAFQWPMLPEGEERQQLTTKEILKLDYVQEPGSAYRS